MSMLWWILFHEISIDIKLCYKWNLHKIYHTICNVLLNGHHRILTENQIPKLGPIKIQLIYHVFVGVSDWSELRLIVYFILCQFKIGQIATSSRMILFPTHG